MSRSRWLCCLMMVPALLTAQTSEIQNPQDLAVLAAVPNCVDIRACGMGRVTMAGNQSAEAIFTNPAAVAVMDKTSIGLGGRIRMGTISDGFHAEMDKDYSAYASAHIKLTNFAGSTVLGFPTSPFTIGIGVGYHTAYDLGHNIVSVRQDASGTGTVETTEKFSGGLNTISPSLSFGLSKKYAIGVTFHKSVPFLEALTYESSTGSFYEVAGSAYYATFGVMLKPVAPLEIGLSFSTAPSWQFTKYRTVEDEEWTEEADAATIPWLAGLAGQYRITEKLAAALEVQTRMFSALTRSGEDFDNGIAVHLGGEYVLGGAPLRLGMILESVPRGNEEYDIATDDYMGEDNSAALAIGATAGVSVPIKKAKIDLALQWNRFAVDQDYGDETFTYSQNNFRVDAGLTFDLPAINLAPKETVVPDSLTPEIMEEPGQRRPHY